METGDPLTERLKLLEKKLLHPDVRKSPRELADLLSDDFVEFGSSGRKYGKQEVITGLMREPVQQMTLADFQARVLSPNVVLVTYRVLKSASEKFSLRSSIWRLSNDRWQIVFHQGTPTGPA